MTPPHAWPPFNREIYSYSMPENLGPDSAWSLPFFRRKNRWRALLLVVPALIEIPYLLFLTLTRGAPRRFAFVNKIAIGVLDATRGSETIVLGSVSELPLALRKGALWVPVSALYIVLAWSRWTTEGGLPIQTRLAMKVLHRILASRLPGNSWLVMHSDALPLARALAAIVRDLGSGTCCVQHGIFHESYRLPEVDGSLCDVNVVRSKVDARIIRRANPVSTMLIEPSLFRPPRPRSVPTQLRVSLIGEAWHTCDKAFDKLHRRKLRDLEAALIDSNIAVSFRPHPSERYRALFYGFRHLDFGQKYRAFERFNVFVGYASTLLNEAAAVGHLAIQLIHAEHTTPTIIRDGGPEIPRVQTPDQLLALLSQAGHRHRHADAPLNIEGERARAAARVIATLRSFTRASVIP